MKKTALIVIAAFSITQANDEVLNKILTFHKAFFGGGVEFNATKIAKEKYKITLLPQKEPFFKFFHHKPSITLQVDEGPFVSVPKFTLAKAGFLGKTNFFTLIDRKKPKDLKKDVFLTLKGVVSFSDKLQETILLDAINIESNKSSFFISPVQLSDEINLNDYTGWAKIYINSISLKGKVDNSLLTLQGISSKNEYFAPPINNLYLFSKNHTHINKFHLLTKDKYHLNITTSFDFASALMKKNQNFSLLTSQFALKSLDKNTTLWAKGVEEIDFELKLDNLGTKGVIDFIKFSQKMQQAQANLAKAANSNNDVAIQKAILQVSEVNNQLVPIFNELFIANKSKISLNLILQELKENHIKIDLIYKGQKLSGSLQSAYISILAQNLNLFDGDFDIAINRDFAFNLYPLSTLLLDLLKTKGLAKEKDGIYYLKGQLKDGKIIINNHAYSLQELNMLLFKGL